MDEIRDTLTIPHDIYARIAAYASAHGQSLDSVVAAWLSERLGEVEVAPPESDAETQARERELAGLEGMLSAPVERDWADQHDLYVASEAPVEDAGADD